MQTIDKLITTLGTGNYNLAHYRLDEDSKQIETCFFPVAVTQWFRPKEVHVLLTKTARAKNWQQCNEELSKLISAENIHEKSIPDGKSEQELWQIFEAIAGVVSQGDRVVIDVTHGFRTLPMLVLLAVAYLRQVKSVQVERVLYGAFDAKGSGVVVPVFDLTPFVSLFDWLTAAKIFMTTGDGQELAELMEKPQNEAHRAGAPNPPRALKPLAAMVQEVSENLLLSRVPALAQSVKKLQERLGESSLEEEVKAWLPPLVPLFDQIQHQYEQFAEESLSAQLQLIRWYHAHGHLVQAYTLAREWIVNYELYKQNEWEMRYDKEKRDEIESKLRKTQSAENCVVDLWSRLGDYRNDIAHCGFRKDLKPAKTLKRDLGAIVEQLESLLPPQDTG